MSYWDGAMSRWASNATWLRPKGSKTAQKGAKRVRHVALGPRHVVLGFQRDVAPSQRVQNSPKGSEKSAPRRIGPRHVALDLQRDVAPPPRRQNSPKRSKKSAPRRIVPPPCRVGPPTRRVFSTKAAKQPKREPKASVTSYWAPAMSCWASNATWLRHFRLHHTVTDSDKRWRNHFGSKRGGLCVAVGSI